jgi:hypothetical protein
MEWLGFFMGELTRWFLLSVAATMGVWAGIKLATILFGPIRVNTTNIPSVQRHGDRRDEIPIADRCVACGWDRKEHSYNGACYGLCGEFHPSDKSQGGDA